MKAKPAKKASRPAPKTKGDVTRERIREAVIRLVSRRGLNNLILQDICDEAKITHGGFYFHFDSKEDAMLDVAQEWISSFKSKVLETPYFDDFYDEVHAMIAAYIRGYTEEIEVTRLVYALDPTHDEIRGIYTRYQRRWWARLEELFTRVRRRAGLPTGMEPWIVHALTTALEGVCVNVFLQKLPEVAIGEGGSAKLAERLAVVWHRCVLGTDPDVKKLKLIKQEVERTG